MSNSKFTKLKQKNRQRQKVLRKLDKESRMNEDFQYCMNYIAAGNMRRCEKLRGLNNLRPKLSLFDVKILETGLKSYKERLDQDIKEYEKTSIQDELYREMINDAKCDQEECDRILGILKDIQMPIFKKLKEFDVSHMYAHKLIGKGYWTSGGTIQ